MQIFNTPASAEPWEDRSPTNVSIGATLALNSDAGGTVRATYTVPAGKRARIGNLNTILQVTTLEAAGWARALWTMTPSGGSAKNIGGAVVDTTNVLTQAIANGNGDIFLNAGDKLDLTTVTSGVTAVIQTFAGAAILEFDA